MLREHRFVADQFGLASHGDEQRRLAEQPRIAVQRQPDLGVGCDLGNGLRVVEREEVATVVSIVKSILRIAAARSLRVIVTGGSPAGLTG
jgi:hypothetical protein